MLNILIDRYSETFKLPRAIIIWSYLPATLLLAVVMSTIMLYFRNTILLFATMSFLFNWNIPLIRSVYALEKPNTFKVNEKVARRFLFYLFLDKNPALICGLFYVLCLLITSLCLKDFNFFFWIINFFLIVLISIISELFISLKNHLIYVIIVIFLLLNFIIKSINLLSILFVFEILILYFTDKHDEKNTMYAHYFALFYFF